MKSQNLEWLNKNTIYCCFFFSLFLKDNNIKDNTKVINDSYKMYNTLSVSPKICRQFEKGDDKLGDIAKPMHYQKELLLMLSWQDVANI